MTTKTPTHTPTQLDKIIHTHQFDNPILAVQTERGWTLCGVTYQALPCGCAATGGGVLPSPLTVTLCAMHLRCVNEREELLKFIQLVARLETADEFDAKHNDEGMSGDDAVDSLSNLIEMARQVLARAKQEEG